jgi:TPR repeat protein
LLPSSDRDLKKAFYWYRKASEAGDTEAMCELSLIYSYYTHDSPLQRLYGQKISQTEAKQKINEWLTKGAEGGRPRAMYLLGMACKEGWSGEVQPARAVEWWTKGARAGLPRCYLELGAAYEEGWGVEKSDNNLKQAVSYYEMAAAKGLDEAMLRLAMICNNNKDFEKTFAWFLKAAEAGNVKGMRMVGADYKRGVGVEQNGTEAVRWLKSAAEGGDNVAMFLLGEIYDEETLIPKDWENWNTAYRWYKKAEKAGYSDAGKRSEDLAARIAKRIIQNEKQ